MLNRLASYVTVVGACVFNVSTNINMQDINTEVTVNYYIKFGNHIRKYTLSSLLISLVTTMGHWASSLGFLVLFRHALGLV
jgi:hypothetical protein